MMKFLQTVLSVLVLCHAAAAAPQMQAAAKPEGSFAETYADGSLKVSGAFKNGLPDGTWIRWFSNGQKAQELFYDNGKIEGKGTVWYPTGGKRSDRMFQDDQGDGVSRWG